MADKFLILANSMKQGGRCLAGILNPYSASHRWCRLVATPQGDALNSNIPVVNKTKLGNLNPLDIIDINLGSSCPLQEQPENIILNCSRNIIYIKTETKPFITQYIQTPTDIWGIDSVSEIKHFGPSLLLLKINNPKKSTSFDRPSLYFNYNGKYYNIRCTVDNFVYMDIPEHQDDCIVCISPGVKFNDAYYKFVAGIIL